MNTRAKRSGAAFLASATLSGAPSTALALLHGDDILRAARAAATVLPGRRERPGLVAGVVAHLTISAAWTAVLEPPLRRLSRERAATVGALAGLGIAALDLGVIARGYPAIHALPRGAQVADHVAFGAIVGWMVGRR